MIQKLNSTINKVNNVVGIDMNLPKPTKSGLKISRAFTGALGLGCIIIGRISSSKSLVCLGALSAISTIATTHEIRKYK